MPNGRRDYFELGPHLRNLENQLSVLFRRIVGRCRKASLSRNAEKRISSALDHLDDTFELAASGYLAPEHAGDLVEEALKRLSQIRSQLHSMNGENKSHLTRVDATEVKLTNFKACPSGLSLIDIPPSEVKTYQRFFKALAATSKSHRATKETIEAVLQMA